MNCSATTGMTLATSLRRVVYSIGVLAALIASSVHADGMEELEDAAGRIQYAYYTEDARSLEEALTAVARLEVESGLASLKNYYLAYGNWRLAQILGAAPNGAPRTARSRAEQACTTHAEAAMTADARFADAFAVHAVCALGESAPDKPADRSNCRSRSLRTATSLAPANPRVRLIETLCAQNLEVERVRDVVLAFESAPPRTSRAPDWGHAEALVLLGRGFLSRGDQVAARDAIERALVIAPDYRQAQTLLSSASSRPR